ncbi:hypothetical protein IW19_00490 [Flavobacterium reichenbachii]|uniref:Uncharacterized protein n=2 Tax=Flavobacterium reichenbachii TaxID=362418 RepID=A0A085ZI34_9FLAO|nr:hypothetical protein IW19_00490 [Flavobacterium reichenbachii]
MKKIKKYIDENPDVINILLGVILLTIAGFVYFDFEIMFKVFIGVVIFGIVIGLISFLIRILSK